MLSNLTLGQRAHLSLGLSVNRRRADVSQFQGGTSAKDDQRWKYRGGVIRRAPSLYLDGTGRVHRDPKEPPGRDLPRRQQESNFLLTINTNKSPRDAGIAFQVAAEAAADALETLSQDFSWIEFGAGPKGNAEFRSDRFAAVVEHVDWYPAVEIGSQVHRLHTHTRARFIHYSQLRVNVRALQYAFRAAFNSKFPIGHPMRIEGLPYVHVRLLSQTESDMIMGQYLAKDRMGQYA